MPPQTPPARQGGQPPILYPVYRPQLSGNEKRYVNECLDSSWISSKGRFVGEFEAAFARYTGLGHATSVSNGTVALHLALEALGIGAGDEVIVPTFTYVASVNTIAQTGALPVFADSQHGSWNLDVADVRQRITPRTRAVMAVHIYGLPCDMHALAALCREHDLLLVEDCAEAFGSWIGERHAGSFGDVATFSFFGNKTITTGEGGMVASRDAGVVERAYHLKTQGLDPSREYWHDMLGYNYRMTNICAALGLAQLEQADAILERKHTLAAWYREELRDLPLGWQEAPAGVRHSHWMCSVLLPGREQRDSLRRHLRADGVETRPFFPPVHTMSHHRRAEAFPVATELAARGINLPSYPALTREDVAAISQSVRSFFAHAGHRHALAV